MGGESSWRRHWWHIRIKKGTSNRGRGGGGEGLASCKVEEVASEVVGLASLRLVGELGLGISRPAVGPSWLPGLNCSPVSPVPTTLRQPEAAFPLCLTGWLSFLDFSCPLEVCVQSSHLK